MISSCPPSSPEPLVTPPSGASSAIHAYEELPIQGDFIRLLDLLPGTPLKGRLRCVELTPETRYEALSYTWGVAHYDHQIECDGGLVAIGRNLHGALSRLQFPDRSRVIWADALCIDQNNFGERARQVRLMRKIYEHASCVLVDLGPDEKDLAVHTFRMIRQVLDHYEPHMLAGSDELPAFVQEDDGVAANMDTMVWGLYDDQAWFDRGWVQQEIGSAKAAIVHWGTQTLPFSDLVGFMSVNLSASLQGQQFPSFVSYFAGIWERYHDIWKTFGSIQSWIKEKNYLSESNATELTTQIDDVRSAAHITINLLDHSRQLITTDPRDRIYAFLGHPALKKLLEFDTDQLLAVDYEIPATELFTRVVKLFAKATGSLDILAAVHHRLTAAPVPSWAPRWDRGLRFFSMKARMWRLSDLCDEARRKEHDALLEAQFERGSSLFSFNGNILEAFGLSVDRVVYRSSSCSWEDLLRVPQPDDDPSRSPNPVEGFWRGAQPHLSEGPSPYDDTWSAFAATLSIGQDIRCEPLEADRQSKTGHFRSFLEEYCNFQPEELRDLFGNIIYTSDVENDPMKFALQIGHCINRRFFVTAAGYMGLGPPDTEVGEEVCVLLGAGTSFVLHRESATNPRYSLCGECYVYGLGPNEVVDKWREGKLSLHRFDIA